MGINKKDKQGEKLKAKENPMKQNKEDIVIVLFDTQIENVVFATHCNHFFYRLTILRCLLSITDTMERKGYWESEKGRKKN